MSAIVTNARNRIAYNVARSLGRRGIPVFAADSVRRAMTFASRYVRGHFQYPSPYREPQPFVDSLIAHARRLEARVLVPVFEETFLVARHREQLARDIAFVVPDYEQILLAHNKDRWDPIARGLGISVPGSWSPDDLRGGDEPRVRFPVLIKPKQGGGSWGIGEVPTPARLEAALAQTDWADKPWDRFFVQEKISGRSHCVAMLFNNGRMRAKVAYRQIRDYPITGGQATLRVSERHEQAEADLERLLTSIGWHGVCQADFIIEQSSGCPYLIDLNPRLWGSLTQAIASGIDFPYLLYRMALDGDVEPCTSFTTGVVTRWIGGDLAALPSRLRVSRSKLRILADFFRPTDHAALFDDFSLDDPLPCAAWAADAAWRAVKFRSLSGVSHDSLEGVWE
jgi:predicted ATP-grasp superfamily ATP-dependent carboligase